MSWRQEWMWVNAKQTSFMCRGRGSITSYVRTLVEILATCFKLLKKSCIYVMFMCINALRMSIYIYVWCRYQCVHVFAVHTWQEKKDETRALAQDNPDVRRDCTCWDKSSPLSCSSHVCLCTARLFRTSFFQQDLSLLMLFLAVICLPVKMCSL